MKLRTQQRQIIEGYKGGYLAIPAVPGAGKTTTLAHMASELIDNGNLLIVTFTNSGVGNFKTKIKDLLKEQNKNPQKGYEVKTIHSLALDILEERPELMGIGDVETLDDSEQQQIINRIANRWIESNQEEWKGHIKEDIRNLDPNNQWRENSLKGWGRETRRLAQEMIKTFKMKGLSPEWLVEQTKGMKIALRWFAEIYRTYQRELLDKGLIDFEDMILRGRDLLKSDAYLLQELRSRWAYILEDEAQDSNPVQEEILFMLAGEGGSLIRVGDSNQSIMGTFTNSDPSLFRNYCRHDDVQVNELSVSGRSTRDIIDLANYLVDWSINSSYSDALEDLKISPVPSGEPGPNPVVNGYLIDFQIADDNHKETDLLVEKVAQYVKDNPDKTAGILVPTNNMTGPVVEKVKEKGVKCLEVTKGKTEGDQFLEDIINVLKFLSEPYRNDYFWDALNGLLPGENHQELEEYIKQVNLEDLMYPVLESIDVPGHIENSEVWPQVLEWIEKFKTWLSCCHFPVEDLVLLIADGMNLESEQLAVADKIATQARIIQEANPGFKLAEISGELDAQKGDFFVFSHKIANRNGFEPQPGEINVITYHKAKGMEWDAVFLSALTNNFFQCSQGDNFMSEQWYLPENYSNPEALVKRKLDLLLEERKVHAAQAIQMAKGEQIKERMRLLYVAVTRAREKLSLSAFNKMIFDNGGQRRVKPSQSFIELMNFIKERRNSRC